MREALYIAMQVIMEGASMREDGTIAFNSVARSKIRSTAANARGTGLYKTLSKTVQATEFMSDQINYTPTTLYIYLLDRISKAPTDFHRQSSIILLLPILDDALDRAEVPEFKTLGDYAK